MPPTPHTSKYVVCSGIPACRINSATALPPSACFKSATICSTLNRLSLHGKSSVSAQDSPETHPKDGSKIPKPLNIITISLLLDQNSDCSVQSYYSYGTSL